METYYPKIDNINISFLVYFFFLLSAASVSILYKFSCILWITFTSHALNKLYFEIQVKDFNL